MLQHLARLRLALAHNLGGIRAPWELRDPLPAPGAPLGWTVYFNSDRPWAYVERGGRAWQARTEGEAAAIAAAMSYEQAQESLGHRPV